MKGLFFHAASHVAHPCVLGALQGQVRDALRPFRRFNSQAVRSAKQRQTRYELRWEPVRDVMTLQLEPQDSLLRIPRTVAATVLRGWPTDASPDASQGAFVVNRGELVRVLRHSAIDGGLAVTTEPTLQPGDQVVWCGITCPVERGAEPEPPTTIICDDTTVPLLSPAEQDDDGWLLRVPGRRKDGPIQVGGVLVQALVQPDRAPRRLVDAAGRVLIPNRMQLRVEERPAAGPLLAGDGRRYCWRRVGKAGRTGNWIQLLPPTRPVDEEHMDPRAAFCEDVTEVWTQPRHRPDAVFSVKSVDPERYQLLLDRRPPQGSSLFLPVDVRNLHLQGRAVQQLAESPLPHHAGLLRLCEDPARATWPTVTPVPIAEHAWLSLTDPTRSGTDEQREFVQTALAVPDLAILEGPPGSGKTTAICELVQQLVLRGQRVLLCASTHVAIDNVLERLVDSSAPIDAVRVGHAERVDSAVADHRLDARVDALVTRWRALPAYAELGDPELRRMATRTVVMASNLTCGTTMGIVRHPLFEGRDQDLHIAQRPIATMPHWDVLIVDEASKTLVTEFLVPALMARRCIVVGDVRQLPPFADRAHVVANLRALVAPDGGEVFPHDHQRACLLLHRLLQDNARQAAMRWLVVEPAGVLHHLAAELEARANPDVAWVRVVPRATGAEGEITVTDVLAGSLEALRLATADLVLVPDDLFATVADRLPANLLQVREGARADDALSYRRAHWHAGVRPLGRSIRDRARGEITTLAGAEELEQDWLDRHDLASEIAWRVTRTHALRRSRGNERQRLRRQIDALCPRTVDLTGPLGEIEDIGLPSILEVLQEGIGVERSNRRSAFTAGLGSHERAFRARFKSLTYQHRMHPQIAEFPRHVIYEGSALLDANTIAQRDAAARWTFGGLPARRTWIDVRGRETHGQNLDEVEAVRMQLERFLAWARTRGPGPDGRWEVACLAFYAKQVHALSGMLQRLTGDGRTTRFSVKDAPVTIRTATVDRFQGREADLVLLSLRNTHRTGFLDSPNRLNVGLTRARHQLVVVGNARYFTRCGVGELQELARRTRTVPHTPRSTR